MQNKNFKSLLYKLTLAGTPFLILLVWYFTSDPFKVLHKYKSYENKPVELNQGYIRWQTYLNHKDSLHYDSYMFGNSCVMAYPTCCWQKHIGDGHPIQLHGNAESLYNIHEKIKCLDDSGAPIKNMLVVIDHGTLGKILVNNYYSRILHPDISGMSTAEFQKEFVKAFINPEFLIPYIDYKLFHKYRNYMRGAMMKWDDQRNQFTNEIINPREAEITKYGEEYWVRHKKEFPCRNPEECILPPVIFSKQRKMLTDIQKICKKHNANYHIIINPEWDQKKFNPKDLIAMQKIFGHDRVHDFSGKNKYSQNKEYFYEQAHYRPVLGEIILGEVYAE